MNDTKAVNVEMTIATWETRECTSRADAHRPLLDEGRSTRPQGAAHGGVINYPARGPIKW